MSIQPPRSGSSATGAAATQDASSVALAFVKALRKHWPLVAAAIVLSLAAGVLITKVQHPIYQATSMIEFDPNAQRPLQSELAAASTYWDNQEYYGTQYKLMVSDRVLTRVVRDLGLVNEVKRVPAPTVDELAAELRLQVTVEPIKNSRLVYLRVSDPDPKRARRLCQAIGDAYIAQNLDKKVQATSDSVVWLNGQVDQYKLALDKDENALHDFKERNDLPSTSINEASNMVRVEMQTFDDALNHTRTKEQELLARNAELSRVSSANPDEIAASELLSNGFLQTLRGQYQAALKDRSSLLAEGKGENHPSVKSASERVDQARAALLNEVRNIQGSVARDLAVIQRQEAGDRTLYEGARQRAVDLNMKEIEYHRLDRARVQDEKVYGLLLDRMKEADLERMVNVNNVRVVDLPTEPTSPIKPKLSTNVSIALAFGLLLGVATAWMRETLDSSVKTPDDVEQKLGVTFLGLLPTVEEDDETGEAKKASKRRSRRRRTLPLDIEHPELIVHERPLSGVAEAARSIRTNLMFMNPDKPYRTLLVSSSAPAEGKTTVACSIAIALAQGGQRVCIIDCDLRRPRLHRIFKRAGDMGVTNILVGDAVIEDVAKPTDIDNLWSIPSGPTPPNPADLLHSERFRRFLSELGERFDRIVIDSPPLVPVTDAAILSSLVDGVIFVIRASKTSAALAKQGLRAFLDVGAPLVGAVLNGVNLNSHEYSYYHYYYYKRDGYRAPPAPKEDARVQPH